MKNLIKILTSIAAVASINPAFGEVIGFDQSPLPIGYTPLGSSFADSGFQFSGSDLNRTGYECGIFTGCLDHGIGFDFVVDVQRVNGLPFSLNSIYVAGGENYDGAAPQYAPGTAEISGLTSTGAIVTINQFLSTAGTVNVGLNNLVSFSLTYVPAESSSQPLFDSLDVTVAAVPEPATWGLMLLGLGMVGYTARTRRRMPSTIVIRSMAALRLSNRATFGIGSWC